MSQHLTEQKPSLPTYATVASFLERKNGAGIRLFGWTLARSVLIILPFLAVGVPPKTAVLGGLLSSGLISILTLMRINNTADVVRGLGR